jgi:hypothetical protein
MNINQFLNELLNATIDFRFVHGHEPTEILVSKACFNELCHRTQMANFLFEGKTLEEILVSKACFNEPCHRTRIANFLFEGKTISAVDYLADNEILLRSEAREELRGIIPAPDPLNAYSSACTLPQLKKPL